MKDYTELLKAHLARYSRTHLGITEPGVFHWKGPGDSLSPHPADGEGRPELPRGSPRRVDGTPRGEPEDQAPSLFPSSYLISVPLGVAVFVAFIGINFVGDEMGLIGRLLVIASQHDIDMANKALTALSLNA